MGSILRLLSVVILACCMMVSGADRLTLTLDELIPPSDCFEVDKLHVQCYNALFGGSDSDFECRSDRRRSRAIQRGYVRTAPPGCILMAVPRELAGRLKSQLCALLLHDQCNKASGTYRHFLGSAIACAAPELGPAATQRAHQINKRAARDRHNWDLSSQSSGDERSSWPAQSSGGHADVQPYDALHDGLSVDGVADEVLGDFNSAADSIADASIRSGESADACFSSPSLGDYAGSSGLSIDMHKVIDLFDGDEDVEDQDGASFFFRLGNCSVGMDPGQVAQDRKDSDTARLGRDDRERWVDVVDSEAEHVHDDRRYVDLFDSDADEDPDSAGLDLFEENQSCKKFDKNDVKELTDTLHGHVSLHGREAVGASGADTPPSTRWELTDGIWTRVSGFLVKDAFTDGFVENSCSSLVRDDVHVHVNEKDAFTDGFAENSLAPSEGSSLGGGVVQVGTEGGALFRHSALAEDSAHDGNYVYEDTICQALALAEESTKDVAGAPADSLAGAGGTGGDLHDMHEDRDSEGDRDNTAKDVAGAPADSLEGVDGNGGDLHGKHDDRVTEGDNEEALALAEESADYCTLHVAENDAFTFTDGPVENSLAPSHVPFFIPCELVTASIGCSLSHLHARGALDAIYARCVKNDLDAAHEDVQRDVVSSDFIRCLSRYTVSHTLRLADVRVWIYRLRQSLNHSRVLLEKSHAREENQHERFVKSSQNYNRLRGRYEDAKAARDSLHSKARMYQQHAEEKDRTIASLRQGNERLVKEISDLRQLNVRFVQEVQHLKVMLAGSDQDPDEPDEIEAYYALLQESVSGLPPLAFFEALHEHNGPVCGSDLDIGEDLDDLPRLPPFVAHEHEIDESDRDIHSFSQNSREILSQNQSLEKIGADSLDHPGHPGPSGLPGSLLEPFGSPCARASDGLARSRRRGRRRSGKNASQKTWPDAWTRSARCSSAHNPSGPSGHPNFPENPDLSSMYADAAEKFSVGMDADESPSLNKAGDGG